jgi:hypothetical protein
MPVLVPSWRDVQLGLATPQRLTTIKQRKPFDAVVEGDLIVVTPLSSGMSRTIRRSNFERLAPLVAAGQTPGSLSGTTFQSSYVQAIVLFLQQRP